jgi:hypothetical protein
VKEAVFFLRQPTSTSGQAQEGHALMREKGGDSTRSAVNRSFDRHGVARGLAGLHALDGSKGSVALALVVRLLG